MSFGARISGTGSAFPQATMNNQQLVEKLQAIGVETSHDWIVERTGIYERRMSDLSNPNESNVGLSFTAAEKALAMAKKTAADIDLILYCTGTPDQHLPSAACLLQKKLDAKNAFAMDLLAACSGFTYGLTTAQQFIENGHCQTALVIGADLLSPWINWQDRGSCILFGDGAGAVVVEKTSAKDQRRILASYLGSDGSLSKLIEIPGHPAKTDEMEQHKIHLLGREVFKEAVPTFVDCTHRVLKKADLTMGEVKWFVPHQANLRIIEAVGKRLDIPLSRTLVNIDRFANTSSATVPTALDEAVRDGRIQAGDLILIAVFGAGLTYGSVLLRW